MASRHLAKGRCRPRPLLTRTGILTRSNRTVRLVLTSLASLGGKHSIFRLTKDFSIGDFYFREGAAGSVLSLCTLTTFTLNWDAGITGASTWRARSISCGSLSMIAPAIQFTKAMQARGFTTMKINIPLCLMLVGLGLGAALLLDEQTAVWPTAPSPSQAHAVAMPAVAAPSTAAAPLVQSIARVSPSSALARDAGASSEAAAELAEAVAEFELLPPEGPHEQLITQNVRDLQAKADDARRDGDEAYAARLELRVSALTQRLARVQIERSGELP